MISNLIETVLIVVLALAVLYSLLGFFGSSFAVGKHPEWKKMAGSPSDYGIESAVINLSSTDGTRLVAWRLSSRQNRSIGTIILAHGAGGNRSKMLPRAAFLTKNGYDVFALDLRAHGESGGDYMTPGLLEANDVLATVDYAVQNNATRPIVVMGYSYGAVASLHAASRSSEIDAVIADSAFINQSDLLNRTLQTVRKDKSTPNSVKFGISMTRLPLMEKSVELFFFLRTCIWMGVGDPKISALTAVRNLNSKPVLFIQGEKDTIAPPQNAKIMYDVSSSKLKEIVILPDKDHSTYAQGDETYEQKVLAFLKVIIDLHINSKLPAQQQAES